VIFLFIYIKLHWQP